MPGSESNVGQVESESFRSCYVRCKEEEDSNTVNRFVRRKKDAG